MSDEEKDGGADIPTIRISELSHLRLSIAEAFKPWMTFQVDGVILDSVFPVLKNLLLRKSCSAMSKEWGVLDENAPGALMETLRNLLAGQLLKPELAQYVSALLAGNVDQVRAGRVLYPWVHQAFDEWVLFTVLEARRHTSSWRVRGSLLTCSVLTGSAAGQIFEQFFPTSLLDKMATKIGIKQYRDDRPVDRGEFVKMKMMGLLVAGDILQVGEYGIKSSLLRRNHLLTLSRGEKRKCPHDYLWACYKCHVGYRDCKNGTHPVSYELRECGGACGINKHGWFDPRDRSGFCINCPNRKNQQGTLNHGYRSGIRSRSEGTKPGGEEPGRRELSAEGHPSTGGTPAVAVAGQGSGCDVQHIPVQGAAAGGS